VGCDIHFVVEVNHPDIGWVGVFATDEMFGYTPYETRLQVTPLWQFKERDYGFFAALAGVRGDGPEPNDIPEDASELTRLHGNHWGGDGHSHSYCSLAHFFVTKFRDDAEKVGEAMKAKIEGDDNPILSYFKCDHDGYKPEDYRVVFWFDN
jgi:hypothetical protein